MRIYDLVYQSAPILGSVSTTTTIAFSRDCQVQILPFLQLKGGDFYHSPWHPRAPKKDLHPYEGSPWKRIFISDDPTFHTPDYLAIDERTRYGFEAIGTSKSMVVAAPGQGSQYAGVYQDAQGRWLTGDHTFRIRLPKDIPAANFWSLTAYDNHSRSLIQNEQGRATIGTVHGAVPNKDGSFDTYYGPKLPDGVAEVNWIQTKPGIGYFVYLRLYGPLESWFDQSWRPGDPELIK